MKKPYYLTGILGILITTNSFAKGGHGNNNIVIGSTYLDNRAIVYQHLNHEITVNQKTITTNKLAPTPTPTPPKPSEPSVPIASLTGSKIEMSPNFGLALSDKGAITVTGTITPVHAKPILNPTLTSAQNWQQIYADVVAEQWRLAKGYIDTVKTAADAYNLAKHHDLSIPNAIAFTNVAVTNNLGVFNRNINFARDSIPADIRTANPSIDTVTPDTYIAKGTSK